MVFLQVPGIRGRPGPMVSISLPPGWCVCACVCVCVRWARWSDTRWHERTAAQVHIEPSAEWNVFFSYSVAPQYSFMMDVVVVRWIWLDSLPWQGPPGPAGERGSRGNKGRPVGDTQTSFRHMLSSKSGFLRYLHIKMYNKYENLS